MNFPRLLLCFFAVALSSALSAQEKSDAKPKTMVFPPGSKVPHSLAAAEVSPAGGAGEVSAPVQLAAQFFAALREGEIEQAYTTLTKGSKIGDRPEELRLLKQKTKEAIEVFGVISGYELVENKTVGTRLIRSTYISLGKEFPLRWRFYFYKADSVWRLVDLRVDDKLTGIFDEEEELKAPAVK